MPSSKTARKAPARRAAKAAPRARPAAPAEPLPGLVPYLVVDDAAKAIDWYARALGAREVARQLAPGGKVMHAELALAGARFFLSDAFPGADVEHPTSLGGTTVSLHLQSPEVGRLWDRAVAAGAAVTVPLANQFWGDRYGRLRDPFGHSWSLSWPARMTEEERRRLQDEAMRVFGAGPPGPGS